MGVKITIPHIHKIEGEAGFWAEVSKKGEIKGLRIEVLEGLRQIEGILIGRRVQDVPTVVSRICGICPVVHILNACLAVEKALEIKVSSLTVLLRKLFLVSQIIQSHALHLFFNTLADFFDIENDLDLMKKFPKESKVALQIRDFALKITQIIGGRKVHPLRAQIGGFTKLPEKKELQTILNELPFILDSSQVLVKTFKNLSYPQIEREQIFTSLFSEKEYPFYQTNYILVDEEKLTAANFYSNKIEEDLKTPPVKRVRYKEMSYMLGAMARIKNNFQFLSPLAKEHFEDFKKIQSVSDAEFFQNTFYNLFSQIVEVVNFLEIVDGLIKEILKYDLKETKKEFKISKGSGLSAMEAPRGTLFTYFELDKTGRILNCNIITPTAQFLSNLEEDLKILLPEIINLPDAKRKRRIRSLIRAYDPCISCAIH